ncbi:MAG: hypothetical protein MJ107_08880 [Lachnospiraceae bacterium]|nr:hypothetical protein [Lachnospiraceae bacterium]
MINCPKCNELIGDNAEKCFSCGYEISAEERLKILDARQASMDNREQEAATEHSQKLFAWLAVEGIVLVIAFLLLVITSNVSKMANNPGTLLTCCMVAIILPVVWMIIGMFRGVFTCPHCGRMETHHIFAPYCSRCGKRLR